MPQIRYSQTPQYDAAGSADLFQAVSGAYTDADAGYKFYFTNVFGECYALRNASTGNESGRALPAQAAFLVDFSDNIAAVQLVGGMRGDVLIGGEGNDILNGGAGADALRGGNGHDNYILDDLNDTVNETGTGGIDTLRSGAISIDLSNTKLYKGAIENAALTGTANLNLTGNAYANVLKGNDGDNVLDGKTGADTMTGGFGDDIYHVDNQGDVVAEAFNEGTDAVYSTVSYALGENVEHLVLTGAGSATGTGNDLDNTVIGNGGANRLAGLGGKDALLGGAGADVFVFSALGDSTVAAGGRDTIHDFTQSDKDRIDLRTLDANEGLAGNQAFIFIGTGAFTGKAGQLHYEAAGNTTVLSGDVNGDGTADFAVTLKGLLQLQQADFLL